MKILHVMLTNNPRNGSVENFLRYVKLSKTLGHQNSCLINKDSNFIFDLVRSQMSVRTMSFPIIRTFLYSNYISSVAADVNPDLVICYDKYSAAILKNSNYKVVAISPVFSKRIVGVNEVVVTNSFFSKKYIERGQNPGAISIIPDFFNFNARIEAFKKIIPKTQFSRPVIIGSMGHFIENNQFDVLIRALALIDVGKYPYRAMIAGSGKEEYKLRQIARIYRIEDRIEFIGEVTDKVSFYNECDIVCIPGIDAVSDVVFESMLAQRPIIAARTNGIEEFIENEKEGALFNNGNAEDMAKSLIKYFLYQDLACKYATQAHKKIIQMLDGASLSEKFVEILAKMEFNCPNLALAKETIFVAE